MLGVSQDRGTFLRHVWPMYVHELSGFGADFYHLDTVGRGQPDIVEKRIARITPAANIRDVRAHDYGVVRAGRNRAGPAGHDVFEVPMAVGADRG